LGGGKGSRGRGRAKGKLGGWGPGRERLSRGWMMVGSGSEASGQGTKQLQAWGTVGQEGELGAGERGGSRR